MVIGPSGIQFGMYSYEWVTKSDYLFITSVITDRTGQQEILSPINHNHFNFRKNNRPGTNIFTEDNVFS